MGPAQVSLPLRRQALRRGMRLMWVRPRTCWARWVPEQLYVLPELLLQHDWMEQVAYSLRRPLKLPQWSELYAGVLPNA